MAAFKARYDAAVKASSEAIDTLNAMADSPERKAINQTLWEALQAFVATNDKVVALGLKNDAEAATNLLFTEGRAARAKLGELLQGGPSA